ncbi:hypothetical protein [Nonomuraea insulae]|uniref:FAD binding domain-containing protein n=1 Tax=Nonomuraea insulae TaxID=1616787 RepID=A0ABW1CS60_9ACTN
MTISEKMGVLPRIEERATGAHRMTAHREGARRPVRVDLSKIFSAASERHVEIMRDDLSEIYYDAARDAVEYVFGDSITAISPDGEVRFENAAPRRFDLVVGADGLHSNVRRLVFGSRLLRERHSDEGAIEPPAQRPGAGSRPILVTGTTCLVTGATRTAPSPPTSRGPSPTPSGRPASSSASTSPGNCHRRRAARRVRDSRRRRVDRDYPARHRWPG